MNGDKAWNHMLHDLATKPHYQANTSTDSIGVAYAEMFLFDGNARIVKAVQYQKKEKSSND